MVYLDGKKYNEFDEELIIEYVSKRHLLGDNYNIIKAEIRAEIIPYDEVTTYVVRLEYIRENENILIEGFVDMDSKRFKKFLRRKKLDKFISWLSF